MAKRFTHEEFISKYNGSEISKTIEIVSIYKNMHEKIECKCKIHNNIFMISQEI